MKAKDVMRRELITVGPLTTLSELSALLAERRISGVPVVDKDGTLLGVVSQTDLLRHERGLRASSEGGAGAGPFQRVSWPGQQPSDALVLEVMTTDVVVAGEDEPVERLAALMRERAIHRVLITRNGRLCGLVTTSDLADLVAKKRLPREDADAPPRTI